MARAVGAELARAGFATQVMIVGYQGRGSLGRQLVDGAREVRIHGEKVAVKAKVHTLSGFSAHAGQSDLLDWFGVMAPSKPRVVLTHGEDRPRGAPARQIQGRFRLKCELPGMGDVIEVRSSRHSRGDCAASLPTRIRSCSIIAVRRSSAANRQLI